VAGRDHRAGEEDGLLKGEKKQKKAKKEGKKEKKKTKKELFADGASGDDDPSAKDRKKTSDKVKKSLPFLKNSASSASFLAAASHHNQGAIQSLDRRMTTFLLSFLSGHDLLSARLVSKRWSAIIGRSFVCA
jgi:hypothetical protein